MDYYLEMWMVTIRQGRVHLVHGHGVHACHLVLLLPFHPPVLEPYFYLSLCETEGVRNLNPDNVIWVNVVRHEIWVYYYLRLLVRYRLK